MKTPLLTIGIPTYKRPEQIQRTVRTLLPQLTDDVKLVVRDNCSPIPVETLFSQEEKKKFTITLNKVNIGGDANIVGVLYDCDTKYCWTLGDDDIVADDAVQTILTYIRQYPDVSFFKFDSPYSKTTHGFMEVAELCKLKKKFTVYSRLLFMSTSIYNIEKMKDSLFYYYKYLSTMNGQNIFLLKYLESHDDAVCIFTEKHIAIQDDAEVVNPWSFTDYIQPCPLILNAFKNKRKQLDGTLFVGLTFGYFRNILFGTMPVKTRCYLLRYVINNYGLFNTIYYHWMLFLQYILNAILPQSLIAIIKRKRERNRS